jgi:hypothetical protein
VIAEPSLRRRVGLALIRHAAAVSPRSRADWARAMAYELEHLPPDESAIRWAFGCVTVIYIERIRAMTSVQLPVSRWVLCLEMLVCLVPLTWLFVAVVIATANGRVPLPDGLLYASGAIAGPLILGFAARVVIFQRPQMSLKIRAVLIMLSAWTLLAYLGQIFYFRPQVTDAWRDFVLIALLPLLAVVHLIWISATSPDRLRKAV